VTDSSPNSARCPHCWTLFPIEDLLFVATHPDLLGDERLGPDAPARFQAGRFNAQRQAIDAGGMACNESRLSALPPDCPPWRHGNAPRILLLHRRSKQRKILLPLALTWKLRQTLDQDSATPSPTPSAT